MEKIKNPLFKWTRAGFNGFPCERLVGIQMGQTGVIVVIEHKIRIVQIVAKLNANLGPGGFVTVNELELVVGKVDHCHEGGEDKYVRPAQLLRATAKATGEGAGRRGLQQSKECHQVSMCGAVGWTKGRCNG